MQNLDLICRRYAITFAIKMALGFFLDVLKLYKDKDVFESELRNLKNSTIDYKSNWRILGVTLCIRQLHVSVQIGSCIGWRRSRLGRVGHRACLFQ